MERGAIYKLKDDVSFPGGFFSYGYKRGVFIGNSSRGWPRFYLGAGKVCEVNVGDPDNILEKIDDQRE